MSAFINRSSHCRLAIGLIPKDNVRLTIDGQPTLHSRANDKIALDTLNEDGDG